jgi:hypothetical protein
VLIFSWLANHQTLARNQKRALKVRLTTKERTKSFARNASSFISFFVHQQPLFDLSNKQTPTTTMCKSPARMNNKKMREVETCESRFIEPHDPALITGKSY